MKGETEQEMARLAESARKASRAVARLSPEKKNQALREIVRALDSRKSEIIKANRADMARAEKKGLSKALTDRLFLDESRLKSVAEGVSQIISLEDPVGRVLESRRLRSGIMLEKVSVPIGVILMIFEARPNVVVDAAALCLKSGNSAIMKGGSDALETNKALIRAIWGGLERAGLPRGAALLVETPEHSAIDCLLKLDSLIDLVIPRGREGLIRSVVEKSRIPVIKHYKGLCHTYVDKHADIGMAVSVCLNAKTQRPGVCNAMESMLVHEAVAEEFLARIGPELRKRGVEVRGCPETRRMLPWARPAKESDYDTEFLDLILSVKVVGSIGEAISHIAEHGSGHSDAIITENREAAERFLGEVDSSAVFHNCSTRFNDGFEFGLGAEIGISTQKIHARGPMGLRELTSYKYLLRGRGEVRN